MTPEQYADEITKGLWVYPKRKREIQQEIIEHLEDAGEEHGIEEWTEDDIHAHFGSKKQLKKQFTKGGLPMWAKWLKRGLWGIVGLIILFIVADIIVLLSFSVDPTMIKVYRANKLFFDHMTPGAMSDPHKNTTWLNPTDDNAVKTWDIFEQCLERINLYDMAYDQAYNEYLARPEIAQKIENAPQPTMMPGAFGGMATNMMPMGKNPYDILSHEEIEQMNAYITDQCREEMDALLEVWTQITPDSKFQFKKPEVTSRDLELYEKYVVNATPQPNPQVGIPQKEQWLSIAQHLAKQSNPPKKEDIILQSKMTFARQPYYLRIQGIVGRIRDHIHTLPPEQAKDAMIASSLWITKYAESVNPNYELLIDLLIIAAQTNTVGEMLTKRVDSIETIDPYKEALQAFVDIPVGKTIEDFPDFEGFQPMQQSVINAVAMGLGSFSFFQAQCSAMQLFYEPDSDGYIAYELMKRGISLMLLNIAMPNFDNARERVKTSIAHQQNARAVLAIENHLDAQKPLRTFQPSDYRIEDPFQDEGLKFELSEHEAVLSSAGNNRRFDPGILYQPSNGMRSTGDLIWKLSMD